MTDTQKNKEVKFKLRWVWIIMTVFVAFLIGIVLGATLIGTIGFHYTIGPTSGTATMTPSTITIELGTLPQGTSGSGYKPLGFAQVDVSGSNVGITHTLNGDLDAFSSFYVYITYYNSTSGAFITSIYLSLTTTSQSYNLAVCNYDLSLSYDYTVKATATTGTTGTVNLELS